MLFYFWVISCIFSVVCDYPLTHRLKRLGKQNWTCDILPIQSDLSHIHTSVAASTWNTSHSSAESQPISRTCSWCFYFQEAFLVPLRWELSHEESLPIPHRRLHLQCRQRRAKRQAWAMVGKKMDGAHVPVDRCGGEFKKHIFTNRTNSSIQQQGHFFTPLHYFPFCSSAFKKHHLMAPL